jgi:uncharacterized protein (TIGR00369 family)
LAISLELINQWFTDSVPHNKALGLRMVELIEDGAIAELPHDDKLVGNPERGFLHGGVITSMIDATCGMAVFIAIKKPVRIATLDLRIDYLRPTTPETNVLCKAVCYKHTRQVAFVRALAHHGDESDPVASAAGTFMIFGDNMSAMAKQVKP